MFKKRFKVSCDFIEQTGAKGVVSFETKFLFDLRRPRFEEMLKREIIKCAYEEQEIVIEEIGNLKIEKIG